MATNMTNIDAVLKSSLNEDQQWKQFLEMCLLLEIVAKTLVALGMPFYNIYSN